MPCPTTGAHTLCASLCNRNAHGHVTRAHFMRRFTGKMPQTKVARQTLCEHVTTAHFMLKSTGEKTPEARLSNLIKHRPWALPWEPQSGHAVWGIKESSSGRVYASLRSRNAEGDITTPFYTRSLRKMPRPRTETTWNNHFARACTVEMYLDMPQEPIYARILRENDVPQDHDNRFARACTVELHVDSHKNHCMREFTEKKPQLRMKHPWSSTGLNPYCKNPQCGCAVWGNKWDAYFANMRRREQRLTRVSREPLRFARFLSKSWTSANCTRRSNGTSFLQQGKHCPGAVHL